MKQILLALIVFVPTLVSSQTKKDESCEHSKTRFSCVEYLKNYDADTITFSIPGVHPLLGEKISVRVRGVDAPEIKGKLPCEKDQARTAQRLIENLMKRAQRVDLENVDRDKYFRILADVKIDGKDLRELLLKNQLAYEYNGGTKIQRDWCKRLPASQ